MIHFVIKIDGGWEIRTEEEGHVGFSQDETQARKWAKQLNLSYQEEPNGCQE